MVRNLSGNAIDLFNRLSKNPTGRGTFRNTKQKRKEISGQQELGTFLPDEYYAKQAGELPESLSRIKRNMEKNGPEGYSRTIKDKKRLRKEIAAQKEMGPMLSENYWKGVEKNHRPTPQQASRRRVKENEEQLRKGRTAGAEEVRRQGGSKEVLDDKKLVENMENAFLNNEALAEKLTGTSVFNKKHTVPFNKTANQEPRPFEPKNTRTNNNAAPGNGPTIGKPYAPSGSNNPLEKKAVDFKKEVNAKKEAERAKQAGFDPKVNKQRHAEGAAHREGILSDHAVTCDTFFSRIGATGKTLLNSGGEHFSQEGAVKKALQKTVTASAASAGGHMGLAAVQGEDVWEAAKTGAFRGAVVGGGYQGLKGVTRADASSIRGNLKQIGSGLNRTYKSTNQANHASMAQRAEASGGVSKQLEKILRANQMNEVNKTANGLK
jgi:hypothetical protein